MVIMHTKTLLPFLGAACSYADLIIPQTEHYVSSMLSQFSRYTDFSASPMQTSTAVPSLPTAAATTDASCLFWMETITHRGIAAFNGDASYQVFRNVKDYGAKGDGITDDTAAINAAISSGGRFGPASRTTSTITPAVVYFPAGTYIISTSIIDYYYTQIIGNPNCMPVLKATPGFVGFGLIDGNQYQPDGHLGWGSTNTFYRQIRNLIFDMTTIAGTQAATGIHWPTAQATSLQNCVFKMSSIQGTQHQGVFIEEGSGGWATDLIFQGGLYGMNQGNQQFTMRNLTFSNCVVAISQIWDWGWTYQGININNCSVGLDMSAGGATGQSVASVVLLDSTISNTPIGIKTAHGTTSLPPSSGSLVLENILISNVGAAVQRTDGTTLLAGSSGSETIVAWAQGHRYNPDGLTELDGHGIYPNPRSSSLLTGTKFYQRSKPQYKALASSSFLSVRSYGATGNGNTDDTAAVQRALNAAAAGDLICYFDAGTYVVTSTITIPPGSKVIGESYSVILSSGTFFANAAAPQPVVKVASSGQSGTVEWSDMIVSTRGAQAGATLIEWNLASPAGYASGMWDVHTRIGGFVGSNLQIANCPMTPITVITSRSYARQCVGAYMSMHITPAAKGLYMENNWFWSADHDIDTVSNVRVTVYSGRGLLIESSTGPLWLYGTAVEHHVLYQYQLLKTSNIVMGQIQTETPYFQPNPNATIPFATNAALNDPTFPTSPYTNGTGLNVPNAEAWGLRVVSSQNVLVYGAGLYSFFINNGTSCSDQGNNAVCQSRILSLEGGSNVYFYDLHSVGTRIMLRQDGTDRIDWSNNQAGFSEEVAIFKPAFPSDAPFPDDL